MKTYLNSSHYLHRAYRQGYLSEDEDCPFACGTKEWSWWWDGWTEAAVEKISLKGNM
tara:strand:+ start:1109 stop:1279 length:171 start_codon:yes stop_codon:yes gene_type:complete